jgi:hypothetical protein
MSIDPFDDVFEPDAKRLTAVSRRKALVLLVAGPSVVASGSGCTLRRLACVVPGEVREGHCEHRFCRYHQG